MRSNKQFIEITGYVNSKKYLINKNAIIFATTQEPGERAVLLIKDGDRMRQIPTKESYVDISEELLWNPHEYSNFEGTQLDATYEEGAANSDD